jgi:uncharacterized membrane protein YvbJ
MFCGNCGEKAEQDKEICPSCGASLPLFEIQSETDASIPPAPVEQPVIQPEEQKPLPQPEQTTKEKVFFGKPAFIFCICVIGVLSITCGILMGLYLKAAGMI